MPTTKNTQNTHQDENHTQKNTQKKITVIKKYEKNDKKNILDFTTILSSFKSPIELKRYMDEQNEILFKLKEQEFINSCSRFWLSHDELQTIYSFLWYDRIHKRRYYLGGKYYKNKPYSVVKHNEIGMTRCCKCKNIVFKDDTTNKFCLEECYRTSAGVYHSYNHPHNYLCNNCVFKYHNHFNGFKPVCPCCKSVSKFHLINYNHLSQSIPAEIYIKKIVLNGYDKPYTTATTIKIKSLRRNYGNPDYNASGCNWIYTDYDKKTGKYNLVNTNSFLFKIIMMYQRVKPEYVDILTEGIFNIEEKDIDVITTSNYRHTISKTILKARLELFKKNMKDYLDFKNASFHRSILDNHRLEHAYTGNIIINPDKVTSADIRMGKIIDGKINKDWFMYAVSERCSDDEDYDYYGERLKYDKERILDWCGLPPDINNIIMEYDDEPHEDDDNEIEEILINTLEDIHEYININEYEEIKTRIDFCISDLCGLYQYETVELPDEEKKNATDYLLPMRL